MLQHVAVILHRIINTAVEEIQLHDSLNTIVILWGRERLLLQFSIFGNYTYNIYFNKGWVFATNF